MHPDKWTNHMIRATFGMFLLTAAPVLAAPSDFGYVDVTAAPYLADPTGVTDSTAAINAAIIAARDADMVTFFPPGDYLISDTIEARQAPDFVMCGLVGSTTNPAHRARLVLADGAAGFGNAASPKLVVFFNNIMHAGNVNEANTVHYDQVFYGIDIVVGSNNAGAVALRMQGAEGCLIADVTIDLTRSGKKGVWGIPGSGGSTHKLTVLGGEIGVDTRAYPDEDGPGTQPGPMLSQVTLVDQTQYAIACRVRGSLVVTGFDIRSNRNGPLVRLQSHWQKQPWDSSLVLVDGSIRFDTPAAGNVIIDQVTGSGADGRSYYLNNVYVENAQRMDDVKNVPGNPAGWKLFQELAAKVVAANRDYATPPLEGIYLDGALHPGDTYEVSKLGFAPPEDYVLKHGWGDKIPSFESPGVVNVKAPPYHAAGNDATDDTAAIQAAINASDIVFFPPGTYLVSDTLTLRPNSKLIGAHHRKALIKGTTSLSDPFGNNPDPTNIAIPIVETADDADAETVLAFLGILAPKNRAQHHAADVGCYALKWQAGEASCLFHFWYNFHTIGNWRTGYLFKFHYNVRDLPVPYDDPSGLRFSYPLPFGEIVNVPQDPHVFLAEDEQFPDLDIPDARLASPSHRHDPSRIDFEPTDGGPFDLIQLDLGNATFEGDDPQFAVTLTGDLQGGGSVTQVYDFAADGMLNARDQLVTVVLNWSNLTAVSMTAAKPFALDNIDLGGGIVADFNHVSTTYDRYDEFAPRIARMGNEHYPEEAVVHPLVYVTGHGGGKWYNNWYHGDLWPSREYRNVLVESNAAPLHVYHWHQQHVHSDAQIELRNARYVSVYGMKAEHNYRFMRVKDSDHIRLFGWAGLADAEFGEEHFDIIDTPNFIRAAHAEEAWWGDDGVRQGSSSNPLIRNNFTNFVGLSEQFGAFTYRDGLLERPILYKRGDARAEPTAQPKVTAASYEKVTEKVDLTFASQPGVFYDVQETGGVGMVNDVWSNSVTDVQGQIGTTSVAFPPASVDTNPAFFRVVAP